ncbi:DUF1254 domain-containing protein [Stappia indica]|nr:DUF1254 domain-containing protein [Stappia indica]MCA1300573.1 DUF1254 domain-containing protein [Stappia indica]
MMSQLRIFLLAALFSATPGIVLSEPGPAATTSEWERTLEEAYLYAFPMLVAYQVMYDYNVDKNSGAYIGPFNQIHNEARVYSPKDTAVSTPNSDTPYSFVQLDLRAEPMVICLPKVDPKRYYDVQLTDMYTFNFGYMGSRTTGSDAGCYMVAGPDWPGDKPDGIERVFHSETQFAFTIFRTQLFDPSDLPNVKKVQAGYSVTPLSRHLGKPAPEAPAAIDWPPASKAMFGDEFPNYLNFLLQFTPDSAVPLSEKALRERFAKVGIEKGRTFDAAKLPPEQQQALTSAIKAATAKIGATAGTVGARVNGWQIGAAAGSREFFNGNWALRAAGSKLGIYGNSEDEAVYPFTRADTNLVPLDGSQHNYTLTFPAGQLPPVNAFWSVTMYDGRTQLLIDNPIDRYLINAPMLPDLKKNPDGSLTLYIQHDSPGKQREANWLPAPDGPMFVVMRLYWPKTEPPSVLPLGDGTWSPPGIEPVSNSRADNVTRFGDKSLETVIRTDQRYGGDPFFQGPRGWPYWNLLEYPKPIQNPNLWPDAQSTYFLSRFDLPPRSTLTLRGEFPRARYFKFALYKAEGGTFVSIGEDIAGWNIAPDPGSTNPFVVGNNRLLEPRDYTVSIVARDAPAKPEDRAPNTLYAGSHGGDLQLVTRIYLSDAGSDGAGWAPSASAVRRRGLPEPEVTLADGTHLSGEALVAAIARPFSANTAQPFTAGQWTALVNAKDNDPALDPATAPARKTPKWEKYWNIRYSIIGSFKTPDEQAKIPFAGPVDGGGDPSTNYLFVQLSRKFGPVFVTRGKLPAFPDTYAGASGLGLEVMPPAQAQYVSIVSCEAAPSGQIVDGLADMQIPVNENGNYTIVYSRAEDRPGNATAENGVAWIEWSPRGEGLDSPENRKDFGMLMMRIMAPNPDWQESPANITRPGEEARVMGAYFPEGEYTTKEAFEALGKNP